MGLVVSQACRRAGIGRALVAAAEQWQTERGVAAICVRSNVVRPESHPFYESLGFARYKTQHAYIKRTEATTGAGSPNPGIKSGGNRAASARLMLAARYAANWSVINEYHCKSAG